MKIKNVIEKLQETQKEHGDVDIVIEYQERCGGDGMLIDIEKIEFLKFKNIVVIYED